MSIDLDALEKTARDQQARSMALKGHIVTWTTITMSNLLELIRLARLGQVAERLVHEAIKALVEYDAVKGDK